MPAEDDKMLSITDSLFTLNPKTAKFFFYVFTYSMNEADGFYAEALGLSALDFIKERPEKFETYFRRSDKFSKKELYNWAECIYGEIQISRENEEQEAITELENLLRKTKYENIGLYCLPNGPFLMVNGPFIAKLKELHNQQSNSNYRLKF